jgi:hypothetical protein
MTVKLIVFTLIAAPLFGCSTTHEIKSRSYKDSPGTYVAPKAWTPITIKDPARTENLLKQKAYRTREAPSITIDVFDSFDRRFPRTQEGCANSYLTGIHDVADDSTQKDTAAIIENPWHSQVQTYRFHSDWFGDHLIAFFLTESGYATIELWTDTTEERKTHTAAFHELIRSVHLK